jgi:hypothetical protein
LKLYGVITIDIVKSRTIPNRELIQEKLNDYFKVIESIYSQDIVSDISFTLGDEWQLITDKPQNCYRIVHDFQKLLWQDKLNIYAGIGIGELKTKIYKDTRRMDGPCFYMARDAIKIAKEGPKKKNSPIQSKLNRVYLKSVAKDLNQQKIIRPNTETDNLQLSEVAADIELGSKIHIEDLINTIIENNEILTGRLTNKQKIIYVEYQKLKSYRKIVEVNKGRFNETIGGISQKLNSAEYFTIQRNHVTIEALINSLLLQIKKCSEKI